MSRLPVLPSLILGAGLLALASPAQAQTTEPSTVAARAVSPLAGRLPCSVLLSAECRRRGLAFVQSRPPAPVPAPPRQYAGRRGGHSTVQRVLMTIAGSVGGFFAGGFLGASIERDGHDDSGALGFTIGAPSGAIAGGILAYKWTR